jgi:hypothetical protein
MELSISATHTSNPAKYASLNREPSSESCLPRNLRTKSGSNMGEQKATEPTFWNLRGNPRLRRCLRRGEGAILG